jgi:hypothetical protein
MTMQYPYDVRAEWVLSLQNIIHRISENFSYELPVWRGKPWLKRVSRIADELVSGWEVNGIMTGLGGFSFGNLVAGYRRNFRADGERYWECRWPIGEAGPYSREFA